MARVALRSERRPTAGSEKAQRPACSSTSRTGHHELLVAHVALVPVGIVLVVPGVLVVPPADYSRIRKTYF